MTSVQRKPDSHQTLISKLLDLNLNQIDKYNRKICYFKLHIPHGFEWYILEYDEITNDAFGFVNLNDPKSAEFGYFNLKKLQELTIKQPIKDLISSKTTRTIEYFVEIDNNFRPMPIKTIVDNIKSET